MYETPTITRIKCPYESDQLSEKTSLLSLNIPVEFSRQWPQHLAAISASLAAMGTGCVAGWSAPAIPYLQGNLGSLNIEPISDNEASWIGSLITLGALFGAIPAGKLSGIYGRKPFLLSLCIPLVIGWLIIANNYENIQLLYFGRFVCGMCFGAVTVAVPMYNNEIAEDNIRGVVGVYFDMMWCIGILFAYVMGAYTSFYYLTISCCLIPIIFISTFTFMPESPVYLLIKNKKDSAEKSLRWLRSGKNEDYDVTAEIDCMQQMINEGKFRSSISSVSPKICNFETLGMRIKEIFRSTTTKAVIIGFGLMTFQRLSGVNAVVYYTVDIFRGAGTKIKPETAAIIVGVVSVFSSCISAFFVDRLGRRFLLILSGGAMSVSLAFMTIYFILKNNDIPLDDFKFIPVVAISFFISMFRIGFSPLPWLLISEILPTEVKNWAVSSIVCFSWLLTFLLTKFFPIMVDIYGYTAVYAVFSAVNLFSVLFTYKCVPETKNKSAVEIQTDMSRKSTYGAIDNAYSK